MVSDFRDHVPKQPGVRRSYKRKGQQMPKISKGIKSTLSSLNMNLAHANKSLFKPSNTSSAYDSNASKSTKPPKVQIYKDIPPINQAKNGGLAYHHLRSSASKK